jgi:hypothetical protein
LCREPRAEPPRPLLVPRPRARRRGVPRPLICAELYSGGRLVHPDASHDGSIDEEPACSTEDGTDPSTGCRTEGN